DGYFRIVQQQLLHGIAALAQLVAFVAEPATAFLHHTVFHAHVYQLAHFGNALAEDDIELGHAERRRHFVLHHFHFYAVADRFVAVFDLAHTADIQPYGSVEFKRITAGGGFGVAEHHTDLFTQLVDEY